MKNILLLVTGVILFIKTEAQTTSLKEALANKDTILAAELIKKGANTNILDETGSSLLMQYTRWGNEDMVSFLLRHGAKPDDPRTANGRTALIVGCAYYAPVDVCRLLIVKGANVNATTNDGATALMFAAQFWKADIVELLIKYGANAKLKDAAGKTAIDYANMNIMTDDLKQMLKSFKIDKAAVITILENAIK